MKPSSTDTQQVEGEITDQGASTEQAADLAALQAMAADGEAGQLATAPEPQGPTLQEEVAAAMQMAVAMVAPIFPSLREIYTPQTVGAASGAIAAVCDKHGFLQGGLMGKYGEEIACVAIVGPLGFATYQGVKSDMAEMAKKRPIEATEKSRDGIDVTAPAPAPAAAQKAGPAVTFGSAPA